MTEKVSTISSKLTCLCGAVTEPGNSLAAEYFPISAGFCSCGTCRQVTGALGVIPVRLNKSPSPESLAACKNYKASDRAERFFCSTCGSHMFIHHSESDNWFAQAGIIDRTDHVKNVDTINITKIGFLSNTGDGGIAGRLRSVALVSDHPPMQVTCYAEMPVPGIEVSLLDAAHLWQANASTETKAADKIICGCHCGNIQFHITPPDPTRINIADLSRWLRANNTKYVARFCVCRSCRLATSTPFMPWMYVMPENMITSTGDPVDLGFESKLPNMKGAQVYYSSGDSKRSFCGTCGATLFYENEQRPQVVDISLGIVRSNAGCLAEDIVEWDWSRVSWQEDGRDDSLLKNLMG